MQLRNQKLTVDVSMCTAWLQFQTQRSQHGAAAAKCFDGKALGERAWRSSGCDSRRKMMSVNSAAFACNRTLLME